MVLFSDGMATNFLQVILLCHYCDLPLRTVKSNEEAIDRFRHIKIQLVSEA